MVIWVLNERGIYGVIIIDCEGGGEESLGNVLLKSKLIRTKDFSAFLLNYWSRILTGGRRNRRVEYKPSVYWFFTRFFTRSHMPAMYVALFAVVHPISTAGQL